MTAIPGLRYFRSSADNVNRYRIRDTDAEKDKNPDDLNASPPSDVDNPAVKGTSRIKLQRPIDAVQGLLRPGKLRRGNPTPEEPSTANNVGTNAAPTYTNDNASSIESIPPLSPIKDVEMKQPVDVDPSLRQPYPDQRDDDPDLIYSSTNNQGPQDPHDSQTSVSPTALSRLRQFASLTSILANISRIPRTVALQIDSVLAGLQSTYPTNTNVGAYMMGTRLILRNQIALKPFDWMERAGFGRLGDLASSMPSVFNPIYDSAERFLSCLLYTSPSPRDRTRSRMPSSA